MHRRAPTGVWVLSGGGVVGGGAALGLLTPEHVMMSLKNGTLSVHVGRFHFVLLQALYECIYYYNR